MKQPIVITRENLCNIKLRVQDTITDEEYDSLFSGSLVGIFINMGTKFPDLKYILRTVCDEYYCGSAKKLISSEYRFVLYRYLKKDIYTYEEAIKLTNSDFEITISTRFGERWQKYYNSLSSKYNILSSRDYKKDMTITENGNDNKNKTLKITKQETQKYDDSKMKNDTSSTQTNETTTTNDNDKGYTYGFNSTNAVPMDINDTETTTSVVGDLDKNKTVQDITETNNGNKSITNDDTHSDNETNNYSSNQTHNENFDGRDVPNQDLIIKEMELRRNYDMVKLILNDINSVTTLNIY